jgi:fumarate reductase subunit D
MKKRDIITGSILILTGLLSLLGCSSGGEKATGILGFLQNPIVMIVLALVIVWWLWGHQKK